MINKLIMFILMMTTNQSLISFDVKANCLSDIVSEYTFRIAQVINKTKHAPRPIGLKQAEHLANIQHRLQKLEQDKARMFNAWSANDYDQILTYLPKDLKQKALIARIDFCTPVLDTRMDSTSSPRAGL